MEENGFSNTTDAIHKSSVNERERLELEALYPAALRKSVDLPSPETVLEKEPRFFLYYHNDRVEAFLAPFPNVIDFSLPNTRISSAEFVGLRKLPPRKIRDPISPIDGQTGHRSTVRGVLSGFRWRSSKPAADGSRLASPSNGSHSPTTPNGSGSKGLEGEEQAGDLPQLHKSWVPRYIAASTGQLGSHQGALDGGNAASRKGAWAGASKVPGDLDLQMFELLWKEGKPGSPIRRLKLETNEAGYDLVNAKLDRWAAEAHSSTIMNEAAEAALTACGGHIKENPTKSPREAKENAMNSPRDAPESNGLMRSLSSLRGGTTPRGSAGLNARSMSENGRRSEGDNWAVWPERSGASQGSPSAREAQGTLPADRARMDAVKAAVNLVGEAAAPAEPLADHIISWGSVMVEGKYLPKRDGQSAILKDTHFKALSAALPARFRSSSWILLYSTARDGISLNTLYRKVVKRGPTILVARDSRKHVFGCYGSEEWKVAARYYGNGECFVFQVQPELKAFRWTRTNSYFMYSTPNQLAMGGGTHYSLLINSDLESGYSGECETFGSKPLAGSEEFEVRQLEVWGFK